jgi:hypothetical protein
MMEYPIPKRWIILYARACDPDDVKYSAETCTILEELGIAEGRVAELEADNARLKAPVSDEEMASIWFHGRKDFFAQVIASRTTMKEQK